MVICRMFCILITVLSMSSFACADGKKIKKRSKINKSYSLAPINLELQRLPQNYYGHNAKTIYETVSYRNRDNIKKGKFETTTQYEKRFEAILAKPIVGRLTSNELFAIKVPITFSYDADTEKALVTLKTSRYSKYIHGDTPGNGHVESYCYINGPLISYEEGKGYGSNAFGYTGSVTNTSEEYLHLIAINSKELGINSNECNDGVKYELKDIPVGTAKIFNKSLSAVVIYKLETPFTKWDSISHCAQIDHPFNSSYTTDYLISLVKEIWLYNYSTGEILFKYKYNAGSNQI